MTNSARPDAGPAERPATQAGQGQDAAPSQWQLTTLRRAHRLARRRGHGQVTMEHVALVLLDEDPAIARHWRSLGIDDDRARRELAPPVPEAPRYGRSFQFQAAPSSDLVVTGEVAAFFTECIRLGAGADGRPAGAELAAAILTHLARPLPGSPLLRGPGKAAASGPAPVAQAKPAPAPGKPSAPASSAPVVDATPVEEDFGDAIGSFGRDLTQLAAMGRLDPLVGREREVEAVLRVLRRRTKRNPLLIGEPGVGKTAIVEGVAHQLAAGNISGPLADARLVSVDLAGLLAGTRYRGEFEGRVHELIDDVLAAPRPTVLFIDEFHLIARTGAAEGGMDLGSMLLAPMARGQLAIIGATTPADFRRHLRQSGPLIRRVQLIDVAEPGPTEAVAILAGTRAQYEDFHSVQIADSALVMAVTLARRDGGRLPDAALDLIDDAAALARVRAGGAEVLPPITDKVVREVAAMRQSPSRLLGTGRRLSKSLRRVTARS
jgi:ATP-dependent Clp protease ATP-binding subunit ClpA